MSHELGIDWADGVCLDEYIHSNTGEQGNARCVVTVRQVAHFIGGCVSVVESSLPKFTLDITDYFQTGE